ncbi:hypothetical protein MATL_G00034370 [Megalops atlanticus]|uniref:Uncharacterized protein n=1 Tax=Megalops atlanticus TaxID=7932 RepID=A0A9D3QEG7_MEGAT|nr:hypothetical protein MATL_G00034370 [Megalops atlanticus]
MPRLSSLSLKIDVIPHIESSRSSQWANVNSGNSKVCHCVQREGCAAPTWLYKHGCVSAACAVGSIIISGATINCHG